MKCLVTGGAGFIGSHLCDRLLAEGHQVVCVDNFITGNKKNISHLLTNPQFSFIEQDCVQPLRELHGIEMIFHFASPASPPKYQKFPVETLLVNTVGTYNLLEIARTQHAVFIYASTSEVYGDPEEHPQKESYFGHVNPIGIRACYDEAKRAGEAFSTSFVKKYGIDARIVRIFNTYGPRMDIDDGRVVTNFIKQILSKQPLTINGEGTQTRSFCYVDDLVNGIVAVSKTAAMKGEVVNLGTTNEMTIVELANVLKKMTAYEGELKFQSMPSDDPVRRRPDISKAKTLLKWEPSVNLQTGLKKTLEYFQAL